MAFTPVQLISTTFEDYGGWWLKFYEQGTVTPLSMATNATGGTLLAKAEVSSGGTVPIGFFKTAGDALLNPFVDGDYDAWLFPTEADADANDTANAIQVADNLNANPFDTSGGIAVFDTVALMKAESISAGRIIETQGYTAAGDGGGAKYLIVTPQAFDGYGDHELANSNIAVLQYSNDITSMRMGAKMDGSTNDTAAIDAWIARAGNLVLSDGIAMTDGNHSLLSSTWLGGNGVLKRRISTENPLINISNVSNVEIKDIGLDGNKSIVSGVTAREDRKGEINANALADGNTTTDVRISNVRIVDAYNWGMRFFGLQDAVIKDCTITAGDTRGIGGGSNWADVKIVNNTIDNVFQSGISINGQGNMTVPSGTSERVIVSNNTISNVNHDSGIVFSGIGLEMIGECTASEIIGNTVTDCDSMLISTGFTSGLTVVGNTCKTSTYIAAQQQGWGIEITGVSDSIYADNNISSVREGYAIQSAENVSIDGGVLIDTVRNAAADTEADTKVIFIKGNEAAETGLFGYQKATSKVRVSGLVTKGWNYGVLLGNRVQECEFVENTFDSPTRGVYIGFGGLITDPDNILVKRNIIKDIWEAGIRIANTTESMAIDNTIIGERNAGATGIVNSGSSTYIIRDNLVKNITNADSSVALMQFADADTTPSISRGGIFVTVNTGATSITTFDDGLTNQIITLTFGDANTTLVDGATLQLAGGVNFVATTVDAITLFFDGTKWVETSRSIN